MAVLGVLLTSQGEWSTTEPYLTEKILSNFTVFGIRVRKILPIKSESSVNLEETQAKTL